MVEANRREAWQHTSAVLATLANIHRDPKKRSRPYSATDFQPLASKKVATAPTQSHIRVLKNVFVDRHPQQGH
jgi:hypothetical protein